MTARIRMLAGAVFACLVVAVYLYTDDVYVTTGSGEHLCGNAYDVALIKKNGFVGGEMPADQAAIDRQCRTKAKKLVGAAVGTGAAGLAAVVPLGAAVRKRRRTTVARGEGAAHLPLR